MATVEDLAAKLEMALAPALIAVMKELRSLVELGGDALDLFNKLPGPIKNTAIALGLLAVSAKAVSVAFSLWSALPGITAGLVKLASGVGVAATAMVNFVAGTGAITTVFGAAEVATVSFGATLAASLPQVFAVTAAITALTYVMHEYLTAEDPDETAAMRKAFSDRKTLAAEAQKMADELRRAGVKVPDPGRSYGSMLIDDLRTAVAELKELKRQRDELLETDREKVKRATEYGAKLLADAQRDYLKVGQETVAALNYAWKEHFKNTVDSAKGTADALKALEVAVATEALKQTEIVKNARIKAALETASHLRKMAMAEMEAVPDTTYEAQLQLAGLGYESRVSEARQQADELIRINDEVTQKQVDGARKVYEENQKMARPEYRAHFFGQMAAAAQTFTQANLDYRKIQETKFNEQSAEARIAMEKSVNQALFAMEKEQREALTQAQTDEINYVRDYTIATVTAVEAQTKEQRMAQIAEVRDANIAAINQVKAAQLGALRDAREQFNRYLEASTLTPEQRQARLDEFDAKQTQQIKALGLQTEREIQMQRVEAWRAGNQIILDEQRSVYQSIAGVMGELFDALLDKNKSVWSAIGDVIKRSILNAIKSIITSRLAAALTGMLGYGQVGVQTGPLGSQIPVFGGGGTAPFSPAAAVTGSSSGVTGWGAILGSTISNLTRQAQAEAPRISTGAVVPGAGMGILTESYVAPYQGQSYLGGGDWGNGEVLPMNLGGGTSRMSQMQQMKTAFNIGKPIRMQDPVTGAIKSIPWSQAPARAKMNAVLSSPGFANMAAAVGLPMALSSLNKRGVMADIQGVAGGALAGFGIASMLGAYGPAGAFAGGGAMLFAAGYKRRGVSGLAMTTLGGALAGAGIGTMIMPGVGTLIGAAVGAAVGLTVGVVNLFRKTKEQKVREMIRNAYGVDIQDRGIQAQIVEIANQRFNGDIRMAVFSPEVQELVRLYALNTGQTAGLPRPMYSVTSAQSASGRLQVQPVYSGGRLVANPYVGTTTTQVAQSLANNQPLFLQLNPQQATSLFSGQVIQVMGNNPGAVGAANTTAARSGQGRQAQSSALLEPTTVTA
jgi:hypothetical protein